MIKKCYECKEEFSDHLTVCPKCGATQKTRNLVRKAGVVVKRVLFRDKKNKRQKR